MEGDELRRRRQEMKLSQTELGELLGVPQNTISRWEVGTSRILHPQILRFALLYLLRERKLDVAPAELLKTREGARDG